MSASFESLAEITNSRIEQKTGMRSINDADPLILSFLSTRMGFRTGYEFPPGGISREAIEAYLHDHDVTRVTRAMALFGVAGLCDTQANDTEVDAVIWLPSGVEDGRVHWNIASEFLGIVGEKWRPHYYKDAVGGALIGVGDKDAAIVLDDIWPDHYLLSDRHLNALSESSRLLKTVPIAIQHPRGRFTVFSNGEQTKGSLREDE